MKKIPWFWLVSLPLLASCSDIEKAAKAAGSDPSQLLYLYAVVNCTLGFLLTLFSGWGLFLSILQSVRISGALCVIVSPLLWSTYENHSVPIGIGASGFLGLILVTAIFWKDLYPNNAPAPHTNNRAL